MIHAANVLLESSDLVEHGFSVKIADFGLSRMASDDQEPDTETGTPMYKSPESLNSGVFSKVGGGCSMHNVFGLAAFRTPRQSQLQLFLKMCSSMCMLLLVADGNNHVCLLNVT